MLFHKKKENMPCFFNQCTPIKATYKSPVLSQKVNRRERPAFLMDGLNESTPTDKVVAATGEITPMKKMIERKKPRSKSSPDMSKKRRSIIRRGLRFSSSVSKRKSKKGTEKLTVVLDLDETLVHSRFVNKDDGTIRQRERRKTATVATNEFILNIGDETIRVNRRPGLNKFLAEASELFNLYVFTAAIEEYARPVIDYLDPKKTIFAGRFYRGSCFQMPNRTYAKDLFHVCDDLKRVVRAVGARISIISHMFQSRHKYRNNRGCVRELIFLALRVSNTRDIIRTPTLKHRYL